MRESERLAEALDQLANSFRTAGGRYDTASCYVSPLPIEEAEAVADRLSDALQAGALRRQLAILKRSFPLSVPLDGQERERRERFKRTLECIARLLQNAEREKGTAANTTTLLSSADPVPDGPVGPNGFAWQGVVHSGLTPKPFRAVSYLWKQRRRSAHKDDLAAPVFEDHAADVMPDKGIDGLRKAINHFFREEAIPLHAEQYHGYLSLCDGPPEPGRKPQSKAPKHRR